MGYCIVLGRIFLVGAWSVLWIPTLCSCRILQYVQEDPDEFLHYSPLKVFSSCDKS